MAMRATNSPKAGKPYDYAVIIGRFQPVHRGHIPTFKKAFEMADKIICVIGSSNMPRTIKNPFTSSERQEMIGAALDENNLNPYESDVLFVEVEDTIYQDQEWVRQVKNKVNQATLQEYDLEELTDQLTNILGEEPTVNTATTMVHLHGTSTKEGKMLQQFIDLSDNKTDSKICILGHEKDESSYYLKNFSNWDLVDTGAWVGDFKHDIPVSATHIRDLWFEGKLGSATGNLPEIVVHIMREWVEANEEIFLQLKDEYEHVKAYRAETQVGPFPVQFITTDAVVRQGDQVLLIRRGQNPGKGLWALPGGFVNDHETIKESCIRELKEETQISLQEHILRSAIREEKIFDHPDRSLRGRTITVAYSLELNPELPLPKVKGADDAVMAWWFTTDEIFNMRDEIFEDHYDIIRYFIARNT
jgi:bifunctional NMN adenylyltransferase/nudix hydrolase